MRGGAQTAEKVWSGLWLHKVGSADRRKRMGEVSEGIGDRGALLMYEGTRWDGEDRTSYLDRFETIARRDWTELSADERDDALRHVRTCDLPETRTQWCALGREAGFTRVAERYTSGDDLFRMFSYQP